MDANRYVQLTENGLKNLHAARRRYKTTVDDIVGDMNTPSVNTVKRVLRQEPVFVSTLERVWDYFQRLAAESGETLPYLAEGRDYIFVEAAPKADNKATRRESPPTPTETRQGWISRQVPHPNRLFTGRRAVLERLHTALQVGPAALVGDPQALIGLGGIGKTQTAMAYVYQYWRDYSHVFWVSAETVETLNEGLAGLAEEMQLLGAAPATKNQALEKMRDWLGKESGWLLIMDNADDLETLAPYFPRHHAGRLLLTTRARNTVKWAAPITLVKFERQEGALLLLRRAGILSVDQPLDTAPAPVVQAAMELCDELDGLPLALDQAGAYLAETTITVIDYRAIYHECGLRLLDSVTDPEHASVTVTFTLALDRLATRSLYGKAAVDMVRLGAFLAPDAIPEAIFLAYPFDQSASDPPLDGPEFYREICAAVCSYSLASRNSENNTITIHRLVQKVTRDTMPPKERRIWAQRAVQAIADATPDFEFEDWPLCDLLLPQWRLCAEYIHEDTIETEQAAYLLYQAGRYLRARALFESAETYTLRAVALAEKVYGAEDLNTADYLDELACLYRVLDRRNESEALHKRAVAILEKVEGPEYAHLASKLHNMALLYLQYEEYAPAEAAFLRALEIYEQQPCPDHLLIATTYTQLAGVYRDSGRFDQAEAYCRRALEIYESMLEPNHIHIGIACNNLALLYMTMERYAEAEVFYLRALQINEQARGPEHPETGNIIWGLARVRWKQRHIEEADALFQRAIRIYIKHFGPEHSRSVQFLSSYATFQKETRSSAS